RVGHREGVPEIGGDVFVVRVRSVSGRRGGQLLLRTVVGGPVSQRRRAGSPRAVDERERSPPRALVRAVIQIFPDRTSREERDRGRRTLNRDGQVVAGLQRAVVGGQAQHVCADAGEIR